MGSDAVNREGLADALLDKNVQAFLRVIRQGESSQDDSAYTVRFGGSHFEAPPWNHPQGTIKAGRWESSAAGAYQFLRRTWESLVLKYGFEDFSPANQDCAAVALIAGRGALELVKAGLLDEALARCAKEWASLPGSPYGQPTISLEKAREVFAAYGGRTGDPPVGLLSGTTSAPTRETGVKPMEPLTILALFKSIGEYVPRLLDAFSSPGSSREHNQAAIKVAADALVDAAAPGGDLYQAAANIAKNPATAQAARQAIDDAWPTIVGVGAGGVDSARQFTERHMDGRGGRIVEVITYAALCFLLIANGLALYVLIRSDKTDLINTIIQADIGVALMAFGFWLGTTISSQRKTEMLSPR